MIEFMFIVVAVFGLLGFSFLTTNFIVWAIMCLLGYTFTWKIGTAVWLTMLMLKSIFNVTVKK